MEPPVLNDGDYSSPPKKKAKIHKRKEESGKGKLPEQIVVTIMSFLSVEKAAKLRVVCRQWNELWETIIGFTPRLKFTRRRALKIWKTNSLEYVKGVDKAMKLNTNASQTDLEELTIEVPLDKFFSDDVNRWVEFGVKRRVKKLKLDFSYDDCYGYSATFLANLSMFWLKDLSMKSLDVGDKDIECIFTNSPNLERLSVDNSDILEKFEVACAPNLKYLTISFCENLEHLHISNPNHNIMISCGEYCWPEKVKLSSSNLSQLNPTFCFNHSFFHYNNTLELIQPNPFLCFDKGFPNFDPYRELFGQLKRLCLKIPREVFWRKSFFFREYFPELTKVEHLEVELLPSKNGPLPSGWDLLQAAPVVHNLSIQLRPHHGYYKISFSDMDFKWVDKDTPMKAKAKTKYWGSHHDLEVVTLVGFSGCKKEVELVLNLVKIAASLKKIIIQLLPSEYWRDLSLEQVNQYSKVCQYSAQLLKTHIPSHILVVII